MLAIGVLSGGISMTRIIVALLAIGVMLTDMAAAQTLERIAASKDVRIGFIADQAPFAAAGVDGAPIGYAIDLCAAIVTAIGRTIDGVKPTYVQTSMADAFDALAADRIDLLCGAVTVTLGRREIADFSQAIFLTGASALLRTDSPRDLRELFLGERTVSPPRSPELRPFATSHIGVRTGTTTEVQLRRAVVEGGYGAEIVDFSTHAEGLEALETREIDAYFADRALLIGLLDTARHPGRLMVASRLLTHESYAIGMKRGDAEFRLLVDRALSEFYATPEFAALLVTFFGAEASDIRAQILAKAIPQ